MNTKNYSAGVHVVELLGSGVLRSHLNLVGNFQAL